MITEKIAKASMIVGGSLKADARNKEQGYNYISADKILSICGQAIAEMGIVIEPQIDEVNIVPVERGGGKFRYDVMVNMTMTITDGETRNACKWIGMGSDYTVPEKALFKAITSGHRYFLAKLLNVGEGNEDANSSNDKPVSETPDDGMITEDQFKKLHTVGVAAYGDEAWKTKRGELVSAISKGRTNNATKLTSDEATRLIDGLVKKRAAAAAEPVPEANPFIDAPSTAPEAPEAPEAPAHITDKQLKMLHAVGINVYGADVWKTKRGELVAAVTRGQRHSMADLTKEEATRLIDGLVKKQEEAAAEKAPTAAELADVEPLAH